MLILSEGQCTTAAQLKHKRGAATLADFLLEFVGPELDPKILRFT
jgi:hypothetical protein